MPYTQRCTPNQYSLILTEDGSIEALRLYTHQVVSDDETGEVVNDKIVITTVVDFASGLEPDSQQLNLFLKRMSDRNLMVKS